MFYTYRQNNSGGSFAVDKERGIANYVIIEADSARKADLKAEEAGLYFDGVDSGQDCGCCGDRWYGASNSWGVYEVPSVYDQPVLEPLGEDFQLTRWTSPDGFIHYADGRVESFDLIREQKED